jgi:cytochrome c biogenesis protein CcdA
MKHSNLYKYQDYWFNIYITLTYILIVISFIGISSNSSKYLNYLNYYVKIYVCLFLLWRFRPFRENHKFTDLDRKVGFTAGLLILTTTILNNYVNDIKDILHKLLNFTKIVL